ncbi:uncharacterized protein LOC132303241 [Cornus florida]|uniref:uncharacterized protein LOC132303241 n=1 Tax=Cornus florida TaxID=4283 RepID=UPI00289F55E2|nr:uncharacterized protein LOC132303241 [Cornus florida]
MMVRLGEEKKVDKSGQVIREVVINSREEVAECMRKVVRRRVMISSARRTVSGILTVGAVHVVRYLANKIHKAWKSWTRTFSLSYFGFFLHPSGLISCGLKP